MSFNDQHGKQNHPNAQNNPQNQQNTQSDKTQKNVKPDGQGNR